MHDDPNRPIGSGLRLFYGAVLPVLVLNLGMIVAYNVWAANPPHYSSGNDALASWALLLVFGPI